VGQQRQYRVGSLRDSGRGMDDVAEKIRSEWASLKGEVGDVDGLFGDGQDDVGGLLRSLYEVVLQAADKSFTTGADDYASFGKNLAKMGDRVEEIEDTNSKMLKKLQARLENVPEGGG
jgi:hypothetical protein